MRTLRLLPILLAALCVSACDSSDPVAPRGSYSGTISGSLTGSFGGDDVEASASRLSLQTVGGEPSSLSVVQVELRSLGGSDYLAAPGEHRIVHSEARTRPDDYPSEPGDFTAEVAVVGPMASGGFYYSRSGTLTVGSVTDAEVTGTVVFEASASPTGDDADVTVRLSFRAPR